MKNKLLNVFRKQHWLCLLVMVVLGSFPMALFATKDDPKTTKTPATKDSGISASADDTESTKNDHSASDGNQYDSLNSQDSLDSLELRSLSLPQFDPSDCVGGRAPSPLPPALRRMKRVDDYTGNRPSQETGVIADQELRREFPELNKVYLWDAQAVLFNKAHEQRHSQLFLENHYRLPVEDSVPERPDSLSAVGVSYDKEEYYAIQGQVVKGATRLDGSFDPTAVPAEIAFRTDSILAGRRHARETTGSAPMYTSLYTTAARDVIGQPVLDPEHQRDPKRFLPFNAPGQRHVVVGDIVYTLQPESMSAMERSYTADELDESLSRVRSVNSRDLEFTQKINQKREELQSLSAGMSDDEDREGIESVIKTMESKLAESRRNLDLKEKKHQRKQTVERNDLIAGSAEAHTPACTGDAPGVSDHSPLMEKLAGRVVGLEADKTELDRASITSSDERDVRQALVDIEVELQAANNTYSEAERAYEEQNLKPTQAFSPPVSIAGTDDEKEQPVSVAKNAVVETPQHASRSPSSSRHLSSGRASSVSSSHLTEKTPSEGSVTSSQLSQVTERGASFDEKFYLAKKELSHLGDVNDSRQQEPVAKIAYLETKCNESEQKLIADLARKELKTKTDEESQASESLSSPTYRKKKPRPLTKSQITDRNLARQIERSGTLEAAIAAAAKKSNQHKLTEPFDTVTMTMDDGTKCVPLCDSRFRGDHSVRGLSSGNDKVNGTESKKATGTQAADTANLPVSDDGQHQSLPAPMPASGWVSPSASVGSSSNMTESAEKTASTVIHVTTAKPAASQARSRHSSEGSTASQGSVHSDNTVRSAASTSSSGSLVAKRQPTTAQSFGNHTDLAEDAKTQSAHNQKSAEIAADEVIDVDDQSSVSSRGSSSRASSKITIAGELTFNPVDVRTKRRHQGSDVSDFSNDAVSTEAVEQQAAKVIEAPANESQESLTAPVEPSVASTDRGSLSCSTNNFQQPDGSVAECRDRALNEARQQYADKHPEKVNINKMAGTHKRKELVALKAAAKKRDKPPSQPANEVTQGDDNDGFDDSVSQSPHMTSELSDPGSSGGDSDHSVSLPGKSSRSLDSNIQDWLRGSPEPSIESDDTTDEQDSLAPSGIASDTDYGGDDELSEAPSSDADSVDTDSGYEDGVTEPTQAPEPAVNKVSTHLIQSGAIQRQSKDVLLSAHQGIGHHLSKASQGVGAGGGLEANGFWARYTHSNSHQDTRGDLNGFTGKIDGMTFGLDAVTNEEWALGAAFTAAKTTLNTKGAPESSQGEHYVMSLYADWQSGDWFANGMLSYAHGRHDYKPQVNGVNRKSSTSSNTWGLTLSSGYNLPLDEQWTLQPKAEFNLINVDLDDIKVDSINTRLKAKDTRFVEFGLGASVVGEIPLRKGVFTPSAWLMGYHDCNGHAYNGTVVSTTGTEKRKGMKHQQTRLTAGLGADYAVDNNLTFGFEYGGDFMSGYKADTWNLKVNYLF